MSHNKVLSNILFFLISFSISILTTCQKDPISSANPEDTYTLISTETIDNDGGEIIADELTLTIPASSFNNPVDITIFSSTTDKPFEENHSSKSYRIGGLPTDYNIPLEISIKYSVGTTSDENYLVLGSEILNDGELRTVYSRLNSNDLNGVLVGELPVPKYDLGDNGLNKIFTGQKFITVSAMRSVSPFYSTAQGHFLITFPVKEGYGQPVELGEFLEEAYQKVSDLGFSDTARTNWPIDVMLRKLETGTDGGASCSWFGNNHGFIELNIDLLSDLDNLRITAGHEYFHIIQFLYDTRAGIKKSAYSSTHHWVNEATAAWFEEKFTSIANYIPEVMNGGAQYSLDGMQLPPFDDAGNQIPDFMKKCYGRAPIIKYLVNRYNEDIIIEMYNDIIVGKHPVDAVCQYNPDGWWNDFLKEYLLGNVYEGIGMGTWNANLSGRFDIQSITDNNILFTENYKDLSGKIFLTQFLYPEIANNMQAVFTISGADKRYLTLFKFKVGAGAQLNYLASNKNTIIVKDIKTLTDNKEKIYALVSNYFTTVIINCFCTN